MNPTAETLPEDVAALRALLLEAWSERDVERAENARLAGQNDRLRHLIRQLQRMQFGKRSEKLDPDQLNLGLEDLEQALAAEEADQEKTDPALRRSRAEKRRAGRGSLPDHLRRIEIVIEPDDTACPCCGGAMHVIGEDRSQRLLVAKYADHTPLYRQCQILVRQGIEINRATLAFWVGYAAAEVKPLWRLMRDDLLRSTKLFVDETTAPVLDPGRGRTKRGYFWVIARDDRPWRGGAPPGVVYNYAPGRSAEHAAALLKDFTGVLQTDGYTAYRRLADPKRNTHPVSLAYCWAHCRRQFFDLAKTAPAPIASQALKRIAELYEIEAEIRGKSAEERRAVRQQKAKPLAEALKTWLEKTLVQVPGRSNIAKAIRYALKQWEGLIRFLDDGRIEVDSNTVERAMRPVALTRKNALFAGSDEGAENWAMLASLIETCKLHGVNPEAYFTDVLTKLVNNWPNSRLAELLPWAWAAEAR